jgi:predicted AlkP superfamily pyrophosphatase or phosphodiesterase
MFFMRSMMSRFLSWIGPLLLVTHFSCAKPVEHRLIVVIALDQFRAGYIERYDPVFTGGFRRLLDEGRRYDRALVDHAPTLSFPGHTTIATGAHPRTHGINANDWFVAEPGGERHRVLAVVDTTARIVGHPDLTGLSPANVRVTGLADWIRAADPEARAVAVSTGTALAMVYGGRALPDPSRNHAYWLSSSAGRFVTSTYFRPEYPEWVETFNQQAMPRFQKNRAWTSTVPEEHRGLARADTASYEGDGVDTAFPHAFDEEGRPDGAAAYNRWFANTPFADEALFALATEAVRSLALGQRNATDFLAIAVKSVDRIGHDYGPLSQEQLDNLVRLDRLLGELFSTLDRTVGRERYVVALSADHGAPNVVEYELEQGREARRLSEKEIQTLLDDVASYVDAYDGSDEELPEGIARELERADFVARAMTPRELAGTDPADEILRLHRNAYVPGRSTTFPLWTDEVLYGAFTDAHPVNWGIVVEYAEQVQLYTARSAHGSAYLYDCEVPIVFMGGGLRPGVASGSARTIDIAPTLAALAHIDYPSTVDGVVLDLAP